VGICLLMLLFFPWIHPPYYPGFAFNTCAMGISSKPFRKYKGESIHYIIVKKEEIAYTKQVVPAARQRSEDIPLDSLVSFNHTMTREFFLPHHMEYELEIHYIDGTIKTIPGVDENSDLYKRLSPYILPLAFSPDKNPVSSFSFPPTPDGIHEDFACFHELTVDTLVLSAGTYVAGQDIPAGTWHVVVLSGSGYVSGGKADHGGIRGKMGGKKHPSHYSSLNLPLGSYLCIKGTLQLKLVSIISYQNAHVKMPSCIQRDATHT